MKKQAFTLSELLISLSIIGLITMIALPVMNRTKPNQELIMFRKAFSLVQQGISELTKNENLYPDGLLNNENENFFCTNFIAKMNYLGASSCSADLEFPDRQPAGDDEVTITTKDGIQWILPIEKFSSSNTAYNILVDVNGAKGPNCYYNADNCKRPDRFTIDVYQNGTVSVSGAAEVDYLSRDSISDHKIVDSSKSREGIIPSGVGNGTGNGTGTGTK